MIRAYSWGQLQEATCFSISSLMLETRWAREACLHLGVNIKNKESFCLGDQASLVVESTASYTESHGGHIKRYRGLLIGRPGFSCGKEVKRVAQRDIEDTQRGTEGLFEVLVSIKGSESFARDSEQGSSKASLYEKIKLLLTVIIRLCCCPVHFKV